MYICKNKSMNKNEEQVMDSVSDSNEHLDKMPIKESEGNDCATQVVYDPLEFRKSLTTLRGRKCPCCGKVARFYHRKLNINQCLALLHVLKWYRHSEEQPTELDFFNINEMFKDNPKLKTDFQKLLHWDLIEHKGRMEVRGKKNPQEVFVVTKGMYRISENGIKFAQREIAIPITAVVYNGVVEAHKLFPYKTIEEMLQDHNLDYNTLIDPNYKIQAI
jgi:hypothetical protein